MKKTININSICGSLEINSPSGGGAFRFFEVTVAENNGKRSTIFLYPDEIAKLHSMLEFLLPNLTKNGHYQKGGDEESPTYDLTTRAGAFDAIRSAPEGNYKDSGGNRLRWNDGPEWYHRGDKLWRPWVGFQDDLPICEAKPEPRRRVRHGWVPCEREEAFELPDGTRACMGRMWAQPMFTHDEIDDYHRWVKWGKL